MSQTHKGFKVIQPGILSLLEDTGRFGHHNIGLTSGGPLDHYSFVWANRLCGNPDNSCVIESSMGGLTLESQVDTYIALTGGDAALTINQQAAVNWQTHPVKAGDRIALGFAQNNTRHYLAVRGGFQITKMFDSAATVVREKMGGLVGTALQAGDILPCHPSPSLPSEQFQLDEVYRPNYHGDIVLRVVLGYQQDAFSALQKRRFFSSEFILDERCDRMGFRVTGPEIKADVNGILSEGICYGAIQIPPDGQPIVLLNDRQTIGGYPKIGAVLSLDIPQLTQRLPGSKVHFEAITIDEAQRQLHLANYRQRHTTMTQLHPSDKAATQGTAP
ncbi:MAG: allophanate hydrolase [Proteobacteria bacterium]|nr:MAG: allophanate hydrolase [Pseudomonadota bacterium]